MEVRAVQQKTSSQSTPAQTKVAQNVAGQMPVIVNGEPAMTTAGNLAALLEALGYPGRNVATAVNGTFVPGGARADTVLAKGDRIEILSARQGG